MTKKVAKKKPTLLQRMAKAKKDAERAREMAARQGEKLFNEAVRELFKNFKGLEKFSWPQYAPHWNDGDPCVFQVYIDSLKINDEDDDAECVDTLRHLHGLLSNKRKSEARIILELADTSKKKWEVESLKRDLETVQTRDADEVASKYQVKKAVYDLLSNIDESAYESMFGEGLVVVTRDGIEVEECEHD